VLDRADLDSLVQPASELWVVAGTEHLLKPLGYRAKLRMAVARILP
jgi:hypothetical protein